MAYLTSALSVLWFRPRKNLLWWTRLLRFHRTEPLELLLFQNRIRHDIGFDYSLGVAYRPFLINNFTLTFGASSLQTGRGFRDIFTDASRNCPPGVEDFCGPSVISPKKMLYSIFSQVKFVF